MCVKKEWRGERKEKSGRLEKEKRRAKSEGKIEVGEGKEARNEENGMGGGKTNAENLQGIGDKLKD